MNKVAFLRGYLMEKLAKPGNLTRALALAKGDFDTLHKLYRKYRPQGAEQVSTQFYTSDLFAGNKNIDPNVVRKLRMLAKAPTPASTMKWHPSYSLIEDVKEHLGDSSVDVDKFVNDLLGVDTGGGTNKIINMEAKAIKHWLKNKGGIRKVVNDPKLSSIFNKAYKRLLSKRKNIDDADTRIIKEYDRGMSDVRGTMFKRIGDYIHRDNIMYPEYISDNWDKLERRGINSVMGPFRKGMEDLPTAKPGKKWVDLINKKYDDLTVEDVRKKMTELYGENKKPRYLYKGIEGNVTDAAHKKLKKKLKRDVEYEIGDALTLPGSDGVEQDISDVLENLKGVTNAGAYPNRYEKDLFYSPIPNVAPHYTLDDLVVRTDLKGSGLKDKQIYTKHEMMVDPEAREKAVEAYKKEGKKSARAKRNIDESPYYETVINGDQPLEHQQLGQVVHKDDGSVFLQGLVDEEGKPFTPATLKKIEEKEKGIYEQIAHAMRKKKRKLRNIQGGIWQLGDNTYNSRPVYLELPVQKSRGGKYAVNEAMLNADGTSDPETLKDFSRYLDAVKAGSKHPFKALKKMLPEDIVNFNRGFTSKSPSRDSEAVASFLKTALPRFPAEYQAALKESMIRGAMARVFAKAKSGKISHAEAMEELKKIKALRHT